MNDYPKFKVEYFKNAMNIFNNFDSSQQYAVLGVLALFVLVHRE